VAEQLALQQRLVQRGAVHGQERTAGAGGEIVHRPGDDLLAGAGLAGDQHRAVGSGDGPDLLTDLAHRGRIADKAVEAADRLGLLAGCLGLEHGVLAHDARVLNRPFDGDDEFIALERLGDVVKRPALHRLNGCFDRPESGHEHDGQVVVDGPDLGEELDAGHAGHAQVRDDRVGTPGRDFLERRPAVRGRPNREAGPRERRAHRVTHHFLVIDDQD
jgi:hypothetical protein